VGVAYLVRRHEALHVLTSVHRFLSSAMTERESKKEIHFHRSGQGCQIFLGAIYQNGSKIDQINVKYIKCPKNR
jgi:hypothetical protein